MKLLSETKPCFTCAATGRSMERPGFCFSCAGRGYKVVMQTAPVAKNNFVISREARSNSLSLLTAPIVLNKRPGSDDLRRRVEGVLPISLSRAFGC